MSDGIYVVTRDDGREVLLARERGVWIDWVGLRFDESSARLVRAEHHKEA